MSGYDPNDPNNPWGNQGNQGWNNQQGGQQGGWQQPNQQQQGWDQQQQGQQGQQGQWNQQPQWDAQQQAAWDQQQQQQQQQQQWNQQQQAAWDQQQQQQQQWNQQQQQWQQPQAAQQGWDQQQQQQQWNQQPAAQQGWEQQQSQWANVGGYAAGAAAATADADSSVGSVSSDGRSIQGAVATLGVNERVTFIKKTYAHLAAAILLFLGIETIFFKVPAVIPYTEKFTYWAWGAGSGYNWLVVLGGFMAVSWIADKWARSSTSRGMQYLGLAFYAVAEAVTFVPLIYVAAIYLKAPEILAQGFVITLALFAGLTAIVFVTRKDFSFLKGALALASMIALGTIIASIVIGFSLGIVFCAAMCALAGGYILYYTSRVLAHYHPQQYVAAALALFSAFMLMLWYVIWTLIELRR